MVHRFINNGYLIAVDSNSGSIHVLDEVAYDIIGMYENAGKEEIAEAIKNKYGLSPSDIGECLEEIDELKKEGSLFSEDEFTDIEPATRQGNIIKALCLHVSHACNLNCEYCFAAQGKYHGEEALMSEETAKRAIDFLVENSGTRKNLEVDFFGGEPLLNWNVVKSTVSYARSVEKRFGKNFRFTLTTNGMLIDDEVIEYVNREMDNVVLSLDGRPEVHDRLRKKYSGEGSYDIIVPKFRKLVSMRNRGTYYMRGTFTHFNTDFASDVIHMADLGFTELSMEPVVCKKGDPYELTEDDLPLVLEQYDLLAKEMIKRRKEGRPITFYHFMIDLENGPCIHKRIAGCGSGSEYLAVTPSGELFPCHQFVSDRNFLIGNIYDGITNTSLRDSFSSCNLYKHEECKNCWAKLFCAGGCAANSFHATGKIDGIYDYGCRIFRHRMECAIMLKISEEDA